MAEEGDKLLERMRRSKAGWRRSDLDRLYSSFGFEIKAGGKHDIVQHPEFPILLTSLTRSRTLPKGYIAQAVKLVDNLKTLKQQRGDTP